MTKYRLRATNERGEIAEAVAESDREKAVKKAVLEAQGYRVEVLKEEPEPEAHYPRPIVYATVALISVIMFGFLIYVLVPPVLSLIGSLFGALQPDDKIWAGLGVLILGVWLLLWSELRSIDDGKPTKKPYDDYDGDE